MKSQLIVDEYLNSIVAMLENLEKLKEFLISVISTLLNERVVNLQFRPKENRICLKFDNGIWRCYYKNEFIKLLFKKEV